MKIYNVTNKIFTEIRQYGILEIFKKALKKANSFLFYTTESVWYQIELSKNIKNSSVETEIERVFLDKDKANLIDWLLNNKSKFPWIYFEKEIETAIKHNHLFYVMTDNCKIIGYVKIGMKRNYIHDFDEEIDFPVDVAFIYDTFVHPDYRGKSLALLALNDVILCLKEKKFHKIICHIEKWNKPSIKTFVKAGFREADTIRFFRIARIPFFLRDKYFLFFNFENYLRKVALR